MIANPLLLWARGLLLAKIEKTVSAPLRKRNGIRKELDAFSSFLTLNVGHGERHFSMNSQ
jgi:hypothetical protein